MRREERSYPIHVVGCCRSSEHCVHRAVGPFEGQLSKALYCSKLVCKAGVIHIGSTDKKRHSMIGNDCQVTLLLNWLTNSPSNLLNLD